MLKGGIMGDSSSELSLMSTHQSGLVLLLLFNIYLLEFDDYVYDKFIKPILIENQNKKNKKLRVSHNYSEEYCLIRNRINQIKKKFNKLSINNTSDEKNKTIEVRSLKRELKKLIVKRITILSEDPKILLKRALYVRYLGC
jgi:hypothetical protein